VTEAEGPHPPPSRGQALTLSLRERGPEWESLAGLLWGRRPEEVGGEEAFEDVFVFDVGGPAVSGEAGTGGKG